MATKVLKCENGIPVVIVRGMKGHETDIFYYGNYKDPRILEFIPAWERLDAKNSKVYFSVETGERVEPGKNIWNLSTKISFIYPDGQEIVLMQSLLTKQYAWLTGEKTKRVVPMARYKTKNVVEVAEE